MSKTTNKERIIYGGVAAFMVLSIVGMQIAMVLSTKNPQPKTPEQKLSQKRIKKFQEQLQKQVSWISDKLSKKHYPEFSKYQKMNHKFDSKTVNELTKKDIKIGTGKEIKNVNESKYYYIGWLSDGKIFDSSFDGKTLRQPFSPNGNVIKGWEEGIVGMKEGGIRELSIPSNMAYGERKTGSIPANSPLKFIIMAVPDLSKSELKGMPKMEL